MTTSGVSRAETAYDAPMTEAPAAPEEARPVRGGGLALAAGIVAFGFIGSRLLGVFRTISIADAFGAAPELGAYNVAFRVPDLIFQVLAGATLGSAFVPVFARLYTRESEARAWRLARTISTSSLPAPRSCAWWRSSSRRSIVPALAPGLGEDIGQRDELVDQAVNLTRMMFLSACFLAVSGMMMGILNARHRFFLPALAPMLYNLLIIFGAVALSGPWGVNGLAIGVVAGGAAHLLVQVPGLVRERMRYRSSGTGRFRDARGGPPDGPSGARSGGGAAQLRGDYLLRFAVGAAAISNLTYAWLLAGLPIALFGMAISTAVFPRLAGTWLWTSLRELEATVSRALRAILFFTIPAAVGLALLAEPVTTVLLQRGEFTAADTAMTSAALRWYCLGIVPQAGIEIHSRGFYALGDTRTPVIFAVGAVGLNMALSALLYAEFGSEGLAFAVSAAAWFEWLVLYYFYVVKTRTEVSQDMRSLAVFAVCSALMALFLVVGLVRLDAENWWENAIMAIGGGLGGALFYVAMARAFNVPELNDILARVWRRSSEAPPPVPSQEL